MMTGWHMEDSPNKRQHSGKIAKSSSTGQLQRGQSATNAKRLAKMMYETPEYQQGYRDSLRPLASFLKHLARSADTTSAVDTSSEPLPLWIPDTIVWEVAGDGFMRCDWYFTDVKGNLMKTRNFKSSELQQRFASRNQPNMTVAVLKHPLGFVRNRCQFLDSTKLEASMESLSSPQGVVCLQRFVECRVRASLLRCRWKKGMDAIDIHYLISSRTSKQGPAEETCLVSPGKPENITVQAVAGVLRSQLSEIMHRVVTYLATYRNLHFQEFVCDFVRDKTDRLWFVQVKAFIGHAEPEHRFPVGPGVWAGETQECGDRVRCGFCECTFRACDLWCTLSGRQIHGMHDRICHWRDPLSWSPPRSSLLSRAPSSHQFRVCADCYDLYTALGELGDACAEFGGLLGAASVQDVRGVGADDADIPTDPVRKRSSENVWAEASSSASACAWFDGDLTFGSTDSPPRVRSASLPRFAHPRAHCRAAPKSPPQMPPGWKLELECRDTLAVVSVTRPKQLLRFRLLVLLQVTGYELDKLGATREEHGELGLAWSVLGIARWVALPLTSSRRLEGGNVLNAFAIQHIYAKSGKEVLQWVEACPLLTVHVVAVESGRRVGWISLDVHNVVKNRIELQNIEAPVHGLDFGALHFAATLGFTGGATFSCENLELQSCMSGLVYVPPPASVLPEVLPSSWLNLLSECTESRYTEGSFSPER